MFANWMKRTSAEIDSGCIYISGAVEFDDRPGPVRDALAESVNTWLAAMLRAVMQAQEEGHLHADADAKQISFEIHGLILALHYEARFLRSPGSHRPRQRGLRQHPCALRHAGSPGRRRRAGCAPAQDRALKQPSLFFFSFHPETFPCPPTPRPFATCNS